MWKVIDFLVKVGKSILFALLIISIFVLMIVTFWIWLPVLIAFKIEGTYV